MHSPVGVVFERRSTGFSTGPPRTDPLRTSPESKEPRVTFVKRGSLAPDPDWLPSTHSVADLGHLMSWTPMASVEIAVYLINVMLRGVAGLPGCGLILTGPGPATRRVIQPLKQPVPPLPETKGLPGALLHGPLLLPDV